MKQISNLLTPSDVAKLLQISVSTVYKHQKRLCGFNPAGLRVLRFRPEIIYGIMEGQSPERLVQQFPASEQSLFQEKIQNKVQSQGSKRRMPKRVKDLKDPCRHGIFDRC